MLSAGPFATAILLVLAAAVPGRSWAEGASSARSVVPADPEEFDFFGNSVALDGSTLAVGSPFDDDLGDLAGAAYVFEKLGGGWDQKAKLTASDGEMFDQFGESVAVSADTVLVSARRPVIGGPPSPGSAYVFRRTGSIWQEEAKLSSTNEQDQDRFGSAVALQDEVAVVGAFNDDGGLGSAFVFRRTGTQWSQEQKLTASTRSAGSFFGEAVSISGDRIIVGGSGEARGAVVFAGAAYVFVFNGQSWVEEVRLEAGDTADAIRFGTAVSLDGDSLVVGAPFHSETLDQRGAAYVFERVGGQWLERPILVPPQSNRADIVGRAVALGGKHLAAGAPTNPNLVDPFEPGSVYLYENVAGRWLLCDQVFSPDSEVNDFFGASAALSDGRLAVGAIGDDTRGADAGAAYVFGLGPLPISTLPPLAAVLLFSWLVYLAIRREKAREPSLS